MRECPDCHCIYCTCPVVEMCPACGEADTDGTHFCDWDVTAPLCRD